MNEQQRQLLARYREQWNELNAIDTFISQLERRRREIQAEQRRLANLVARIDLETSEGEGQ